MADHEQDIFAEALRASGSPAPVPEGFADRVIGAMPARAGVRARRVTLGASIAVAVAACALGIWTRRPSRGEFEHPASATGPATLLLGSRGRVVVEPGTHLSFAVGGFAPGHLDRVDVSHGAAFFRIDTGGGLDVGTPYGTVSVTGTCFRVAVAEQNEDWNMNASTRVRWFGAGALSVALAVTVYEGGVRVASARSNDTARLAPGDRATVSRDGFLARSRDDQHTTPPMGAARPDPVAAANPAPAGSDPAAQRELVRLREILQTNGISPETGARVAIAAATPAATGDASTHRRGIDDNGNTDLTPDEWRLLAERGELRFRLPTVGRNPPALDERRATALRIPEQDATQVTEVLRRAHERLHNEVRVLFREATGSESGSLSFEAMVNEIRDKSPEEANSAMNWQLSQERGGLAPAQAARPDMPPYERVMRLLIGYEAQLERDLAAVVGPSIAHELIWGEHSLGGHSYGMSGRRAP